MASKFLTAFALGVAAGILLAPDKGNETRKKIAQKGKDLKNKFNDFVDTLHDKFGTVEEDIEDVKESSFDAKQGTPAYAGGANAWGS